MVEYIKVSPIQSQDMRWASKMETSSLKVLSTDKISEGLKNLHRIKQKEAKEALKRKHKDLWIYGR